MKQNIKKLKKRAQSLVEYGLIVSLLAVVLIATLNNLGSVWRVTVNTLSGKINQANTVAQQS
jgi:Flp pilus assembly pilin Flp